MFLGGVTLAPRHTVSPKAESARRASDEQQSTTASPDLPEEVGRHITRLPSLSLNTGLSRRPAGKSNGCTWSLSWQYISSYVANYADARRAYLAYPGYHLFAGSIGYQWTWTGRRFEIDAGVRNALDRDLLASNARIGAGREYSLATRLMF